ncbi:Extracellular matrix protein FRAS1 [Varanus komodoensis]|nr:Extracellular matrix protein FRAS1 [Varanus komodoensis]
MKTWSFLRENAAQTVPPNPALHLGEHMRRKKIQVLSLQHGEHWQNDTCTRCICDRGETRCLRQSCAPPACGKGEKKVRRPGNCCEECVRSKGSCVQNGTIRYQDEMWNETRCEFCVCDGGRVTCWDGECARVECGPGEELVHLEGKCCPECLLRAAPCVHNEHTKEDGDKWKEGPCRECECRDSEVVCYARSCPTCPSGSVAVPATGECCPRCQPGQCHPDCLTCSQSFDRCDVCRDATKWLKNGRCVASCGPGFYPDAGLCLACKKMCSTCTDGFSCTSCQDPLRLEDGQCVMSCAEGHFPGPLQCTACHESCAACRGPTAKNCSACKDPSFVLLGSLCVARCGQGFYIQDGACKACHETCETCYPDRPRCSTCASDRFLHGGQCMTGCPEGHYADPSQRCRACHNSCSSCVGPLSTQCASCAFPLALHQGFCLPSCGEGFYRDHTVCKGCHSSCRECVGPERSHCTRCLNPEEALQPETDLEETLVGVCLVQCRVQFYLSNNGVCEECHFSCLSCTAGSSQNCTACKPPQVLYEDQCLSECPEGWYRQDAHCHSCHPSCKTCGGPSEDECGACHPHATFGDGKCRTACKEGHYLNLVGYCMDCHPLCAQCVADLQGTGGLCLECQNPRHLLLRDHCEPECPEGYHKHHGACQRCHPSCRACSGRGPSSCTSCDSSLVLSHTGTCTSACSVGFYRDENLRCSPCPSPCLSCDSGTSCTSCKDPSQVLLFGECQYDSCAPQYYLDFSTKTCKGERNAYMFSCAG